MTRPCRSSATPSPPSRAPNRVRVTFLGSGDAFGNGGRHQTCILLETGTRRVLLDCGATSMLAMKRQGVEALTLDAVLLTHLHGDHFGGLPFLILDAQFRRRTQPLVIAGPTRAADLFICEAYTFDKPVKYHLGYRTVMAHRSAFGCKRLVLTHLGPDMLARTADVDAECAYDGLTIEV